jgi:hypothetical protein
VSKPKTARKYGFTLKEFERIMKTLELYPDCHGRTGQLNAQRLKVFVLVMRYAGLRVSDATSLHASQPVKRTTGDGWSLHIIYYENSQSEKGQEKSGNDVYIPIPAFVAKALIDLPFRAEKDAHSIGFGQHKEKSIRRLKRGGGPSIICFIRRKIQTRTAFTESRSAIQRRHMLSGIRSRSPL